MLLYFSFYLNVITPKYLKNFQAITKYNMPKLRKIVINTNFGNCTDLPLKLKTNIDFIRNITGRHPIFTKAKKTIHNFNLKKGNIIGLKVTLRRVIMYSFLEKLIKIIFPKIRNFLGISINSFDSLGHYNFGLQNVSLFPELDDLKLSMIQYISGINISFVFLQNSLNSNKFLLRQFKFPLA